LGIRRISKGLLHRRMKFHFINKQHYPGALTL
jgi:hypothetical protein